jgi:hypothetical protein
MVILHLDADGNGEFELIAEAPLIYLDHWALRLFASEPGRRAHFLEAFRTRGTLMISVMNADEIARTTLDETAGELRSLMDGIGPHWLPMTVDPMRIIDAEMGNTTGNNPCASEAFLLAPKFAGRLLEGEISLVHVVDVTRGDDGRIDVEATNALTAKLRGHIGDWRTAYRENTAELDRKFPKLPFDPVRPMRSIYNGLVRLSITGGFIFNDNHARDLFHTVTSIRCSDLVLLDGHWAEQVRKLRLPNDFVKVYTKADVDAFLADFEAWPATR